MDVFLDWLVVFLRNMTLGEGMLWFILENIIIFVLSVLLGNLLVAHFYNRPVAVKPEPLSKLEILLTISTIFFNAIVTLTGLWLWQKGIIYFRRDIGLYALLDIFILFMAMDFCMYILHRIAHHPMLYKPVHGTHHLFDKPRPLTLFALNPIEVLGFGTLFLVVISIFDFSWLGMSIYLALNVIFGTIGHLGVEPFPNAWLKWPIIRLFTTSTFHAQHHQEIEYNFGFYTVIWDWLFTTIHPRYCMDQELGVNFIRT